MVLNVYDLSPVNSYVYVTPIPTPAHMIGEDRSDLMPCRYDFGVGAFHSGVEIGGTEYTFGGHESSSSGVFTHAPKQVFLCACLL